MEQEKSKETKGEVWCVTYQYHDNDSSDFNVEVFSNEKDAIVYMLRGLACDIEYNDLSNFVIVCTKYIASITDANDNSNYYSYTIDKKTLK